LPGPTGATLRLQHRRRRLDPRIGLKFVDQTAKARNFHIRRRRQKNISHVPRGAAFEGIDESGKQARHRDQQST
jgi:hypothetical protein